MPTNEELKARRLVFYEKEVEEVDKVLEGFLSKASAKAVLLVDKEGHLVTKRGYTQTLDTTSLSALVAGSFASTRELAKLVGESEFSVIFHQGKNENIHISLVSEQALLVIIFDDRTTVGMIRLYAEELSTRLDALLQKAAAKEPAQELSPDFAREAEDRISEFFGREKK